MEPADEPFILRSEAGWWPLLFGGLRLLSSEASIPPVFVGVAIHVEVPRESGVAEQALTLLQTPEGELYRTYMRMERPDGVARIPLEALVRVVNGDDDVGVLYEQGTVSGDVAGQSLLLWSIEFNQRLVPEWVKRIVHDSADELVRSLHAA